MNTIFLTASATPLQILRYVNDSTTPVYFHDPRLFEGLLTRRGSEIRSDARRDQRQPLEGDGVYYALDAELPATLFTAPRGVWYHAFAGR